MSERVREQREEGWHKKKEREVCVYVCGGSDTECEIAQVNVCMRVHVNMLLCAFLSVRMCIYLHLCM